MQVESNFRWLEHAACKNVDPESFFIEKITSKNRHQVFEAYQTCDSCSVAHYCLKDALENSSEGIWGGTNTHYRNYLLKKHFVSNLDKISLEKATFAINEVRQKPISVRVRMSRNSTRRDIQNDIL